LTILFSSCWVSPAVLHPANIHRRRTGLGTQAATAQTQVALASLSAWTHSREHLTNNYSLINTWISQALEQSNSDENEPTDSELNLLKAE
jgi:hypothetical protein